MLSLTTYITLTSAYDVVRKLAVIGKCKVSDYIMSTKTLELELRVISYAVKQPAAGHSLPLYPQSAYAEACIYHCCCVRSNLLLSSQHTSILRLICAEARRLAMQCVVNTAFPKNAALLSCTQLVLGAPWVLVLGW